MIGKFHFWWGFSMICVFGILGTLMIASSKLESLIGGSVLLILSLMIGIAIFSRKSVKSAFPITNEQPTNRDV